MRPITGENGDLLYGARVLVREAGLSVKLSQPLYAGPTGSEQLQNPYTTSNGVIDFWLDEPQRVSVLVQSQLHSDILVYLDAAPPPEETARTDLPLLVTGEQTPGYVLTAGDKRGEAVWATAPTSLGLTPQVTVVRESFSRATDPAGWSFTQAATTTRDYNTSVPDGQGLAVSVHSVHTGNAGSLIVASPGFTLLESGYVSLWMRSGIISTEKIVFVAVALDGTRNVLQTLTTSRKWGFYRFPLAAGTYQSFKVEFTGAAVFSGSTGHEMWMTDVRISYGGLVPEHTHAGEGTGSVRLGTSSVATGAGAIAVGTEAVASGTNSAAFGYQSTANGVDALAVGSQASAPSANSVAVGSHTSGSPTNTGWTAIGRDAYVDSANGAAIGKGAKTYGSSGTAIGASSYVGPEGVNAVAVGSGAQALSSGSLAIGNNAIVAAAHTNSVAIGNGAATSAPDQIMLGDPTQPQRTVVVANTLRTLSAVTLGSSASSTLGFFGSTGGAKPVVSGADGGVLALRSLITGLASLGLITNNTTP